MWPWSGQKCCLALLIYVKKNAVHKDIDVYRDIDSCENPISDGCSTVDVALCIGYLWAGVGANDTVLIILLVC